MPGTAQPASARSRPNARPPRGRSARHWRGSDRRSTSASGCSRPPAGLDASTLLGGIGVGEIRHRRERRDEFAALRHIRRPARPPDILRIIEGRQAQLLQERRRGPGEFSSGPEVAAVTRGDTAPVERLGAIDLSSLAVGLFETAKQLLEFVGDVWVEGGQLGGECFLLGSYGLEFGPPCGAPALDHQGPAAPRLRGQPAARLSAAGARGSLLPWSRLALRRGAMKASASQHFTKDESERRRSAARPTSANASARSASGPRPRTRPSAATAEGLAEMCDRYAYNRK